jgi:hypothetical protein
MELGRPIVVRSRRVGTTDLHVLIDESAPGKNAVGPLIATLRVEP